MKCTRCGCYKNSIGVCCVGYSGETGSDILFLGEMAGREEAYASLTSPAHFIGKAGGILDTLLENIEFTRKDFWIVNSARCWKEGNTKPTLKELDACFPFLWRDVRKYKPKLVVALGGTALYQSTGKTGIELYRGRPVWSEKLKCKVYPVFHPMSVGYDPSKRETLIEDFNLIPSMINAKPSETKHYRYKLVKTMEEWRQVRNILYNSDDLYLDIESTGLDPYTDDIKTVQLGSGKEPILILSAEILEEAKPDLKELLTTKNIIGQDFAFDAKFIHSKLGIFPEVWSWDTCLAEFVVSGMSDNDLDFLTGKYVPESFGYSDEVNKCGGAHLVKDEKVLLQYAADDVGVLKSIRKNQYIQLDRESMLPLYENIMLPCNRILTKMSIRGIRYDLDKLWEVDKKYEELGSKALTSALKLKKVKEVENELHVAFNPASTVHVKKLLLDKYKLPVLKRTKKNNPKVSKDEMKVYANRYNNTYCKIMEKYRSYQTLRNNFLSGVVDKLQGDIAHTTYSLHATTTGRPNSKNPNLLNTPREKDVKKILVARPGYRFVCADFAQLEVRIASVVYDEPRLIEICNDLEKDIHSSITAKAFKKEYNEVYDGYKSGNIAMTELRVKGKAVQFGVIYQQQAEGLAYSLGISVEEAGRFIDEYYNNFPDLKTNIENTKERLIKDGYLQNYFGFIRRWVHHKKDDHNVLREGVNFLVQSLAWNILQLSLIEIDRILVESAMDSYCVLQVYDSIVLECAEDEIYDAGRIVFHVMNNIMIPYEGINRVTLKADIEVGHNLADLKDFNLTNRNQ